MGLEELEKYQIEILIERLKNSYPMVLNESVALELKEKILNSNQDFMTLSRELNVALENQTKLEGLLLQYQLKTNKANYKTKKEQISTEVFLEKSSEIKQENQIEELKKITEGMSEEEMTEYLRIHGKNPSQITMILLSLKETRASTQIEKQESILEKPKQFVLKKSKRKMAAFVDTLYLAFLVGMISGVIFFAMLRFILHSL